MVKKILGSFCDQHCVCVEFPLSKRQQKKLEEELKSLEKDIKKELRALKVNAEWRTAKVAPFWGFSTRIWLKKKRGVSEEDFRKPFPIVQRFFKTLGHFNVKKFNGASCTRFAFNIKRFKAVGELAIPTKFALRPELINRLGRPELTGVALNFKGSPLGVSRVIIDQPDKNFMITVNTSYRLSNVDDFLTKAYAQSKQIAELFMEAK